MGEGGGQEEEIEATCEIWPIHMQKWRSGGGRRGADGGAGRDDVCVVGGSDGLQALATATGGWRLVVSTEDEAVEAVCVCVCVNLSIDRYIYLSIYIHGTHTHTHTQGNTHTHTHTQVRTALVSAVDVVAADGVYTIIYKLF